jgi:hypothetical protein
VPQHPNAIDASVTGDPHGKIAICYQSGYLRSDVPGVQDCENDHNAKDRDSETAEARAFEAEKRMHYDNATGKDGKKINH